MGGEGGFVPEEMTASKKLSLAMNEGLRGSLTDATQPAESNRYAGFDIDGYTDLKQLAQQRKVTNLEVLEILEDLDGLLELYDLSKNPNTQRLFNGQLTTAQRLQGLPITDKPDWNPPLAKSESTQGFSPRIFDPEPAAETSASPQAEATASSAYNESDYNAWLDAIAKNGLDQKPHVQEVMMELEALKSDTSNPINAEVFNATLKEVWNMPEINSEPLLPHEATAKYEAKTAEDKTPEDGRAVEIQARMVSRLTGEKSPLTTGQPTQSPEEDGYIKLPQVEEKKTYDESEFADTLRQDKEYLYLVSEIENPDEAEHRFRELYPQKSVLYDQRMESKSGELQPSIAAEDNVLSVEEPTESQENQGIRVTIEVVRDVLQEKLTLEGEQAERFLDLLSKFLARPNVNAQAELSVLLVRELHYSKEEATKISSQIVSAIAEKQGNDAKADQQLRDQLKEDLIVGVKEVMDSDFSVEEKLSFLKDYKETIVKDLNLKVIYQRNPKLARSMRGLIGAHLTKAIKKLERAVENAKVSQEVNGQSAAEIEEIVKTYLDDATELTGSPVATPEDDGDTIDLSAWDDLLNNLDNDDQPLVLHELGDTDPAIIEPSNEGGTAYVSLDGGKLTVAHTTADFFNAYQDIKKVDDRWQISVRDENSGAMISYSFDEAYKRKLDLIGAEVSMRQGVAPDLGGPPIVEAAATPEPTEPTGTEPTGTEPVAATTEAGAAGPERATELSRETRAIMRNLIASKEFRGIFGVSPKDQYGVDAMINKFFQEELLSVTQEGAREARIRVMEKLNTEGFYTAEKNNSDIYVLQLKELMNRVFGEESGEKDVMTFDKDGHLIRIKEGDDAFNRAKENVSQPGRAGRMFAGLRAFMRGSALPRNYHTQWPDSVAAGHYSDMQGYMRSLDRYELVPAKDKVDTLTPAQASSRWVRRLYPLVVAAVMSTTISGGAANAPRTYSADTGNSGARTENIVPNSDEQDPMVGEPTDVENENTDAFGVFLGKMRILAEVGDPRVYEIPDEDLGKYKEGIIRNDVNSYSLVVRVHADDGTGARMGNEGNWVFSGLTAEDLRGIYDNPELLPVETKVEVTVGPFSPSAEEAESASAPESETETVEVTTWDAIRPTEEANHVWALCRQAVLDQYTVLPNTDAAAEGLDPNKVYVVDVHQPEDLTPALRALKILPVSQIADPCKDAVMAWNRAMDNKMIEAGIISAPRNFDSLSGTQKVFEIPDNVRTNDELFAIASQHPDAMGVPSKARLAEMNDRTEEALHHKGNPQDLLNQSIVTHLNANPEYDGGGWATYLNTDQLAEHPASESFLRETASGVTSESAEAPGSPTAEVTPIEASDNQTELQEVMAAMGASAPTQETADRVAAEQSAKAEEASAQQSEAAPATPEGNAQQIVIERLAADPDYGPQIASQIEIMDKYYDGGAIDLSGLGVQDTLKGIQASNDERVAEGGPISPVREDLVGMGNGVEPSDPVAAKAIVDSLTTLRTQEEIRSDINNAIKEMGWYASTQSKDFMQRQINYYMAIGDYQGLWDADRYWVTQPGEQYKFLGFDSKEAHDAWHTNVLGPAVTGVGTEQAVKDALALTTLSAGEAAEAAPETPVGNELGEVERRFGVDVARAVNTFAPHDELGVSGAAAASESLAGAETAIENMLANGAKIDWQSTLRQELYGALEDGEVNPSYAKAILNWLKQADVKADLNSSSVDTINARFGEGGRSISAQNPTFAMEHARNRITNGLYAQLTDVWVAIFEAGHWDWIADSPEAFNEWKAKFDQIATQAAPNAPEQLLELIEQSNLPKTAAGWTP